MSPFQGYPVVDSHRALLKGPRGSLIFGATMRMDKLTSRFQSALADAQSLAVGRDNQFMEPAHVFGALLDQQDGSTRPLLV